ncbi:hypothetical protein niasHS_017782 [Heterodera schachtii]|uniref:Uncharacterized protein n=1 Tax=Heterodera schachtii TaxID=97005 RepID=A0ABD2I1F9_HETSC
MEQEYVPGKVVGYIEDPREEKEEEWDMARALKNRSKEDEVRIKKREQREEGWKELISGERKAKGRERPKLVEKFVKNVLGPAENDVSRNPGIPPEGSRRGPTPIPCWNRYKKRPRFVSPIRNISPVRTRQSTVGTQTTNAWPSCTGDVVEQMQLMKTKLDELIAALKKKEEEKNNGNNEQIGEEEQQKENGK